MAVAVFLLPLFGAHRLMEVEKERLLYPLDHEFEVLFSRFNNGLHEDDYSEIERLNGVITNLEFQYHRIKNIPTWPWKPETAQLALTAIALPLALTIIRFLIERAFK